LTGRPLPLSPKRSARPLLKWAGGKRQLLRVFRAFYPDRFPGYFEPFVGSGAVFFDLLHDGRLNAVRVTLGDSNADLIGCYEAVRDHADRVIDALASLERRHAREGDACYYAVRDRFNHERQARGVIEPQYPPSLAAMLIYLNRTGFNGLFRLNAGGAFNVPVGRYARPRICDPDLVRAVSRALRDVVLRACPFDVTVADARHGDFLYFDPPYAPVSPTSAFCSYTASRFSPEDQQRLCAAVVELARRGCLVMLSNSSAGEIEAEYGAATRAPGAGLRLWRVPARRAINSQSDKRGAVAELLLTNLEPRAEVPGAVELTPP
jgi:DNA adenine methylase